MSMKETDRRWLPAERDALASEAIGGPSLTYWQDCWHRLCRNKTALLSMVVVVIVVLSAIFVPMFWPYSYEEQDLRYANIPPELEIYDLGGNSFVYVTSDYKCIDTDGSGHLLGASTLVKDDKAGRTYMRSTERICWWITACTSGPNRSLSPRRLPTAMAVPSPWRRWST